MAVGAARLGLLPPFSFCCPSSSPLPKPQGLVLGCRRRRPLLLGPIASSLVEEERPLSFTDPEARLIDALLGIQGRGRAAAPQQLQDIEQAIQTLENLKGIPDPSSMQGVKLKAIDETNSDLIEGCWQLMFTTRPGTASPIQRTFVGVDFFKVFQEVYLRTDDPRVSNIVKFSDAFGELKVEAAATIKDGYRILFQFDRAAFSFKFLPFKVPYPVPFRLLGDEAKGWLDTTYLSYTGDVRISRGNKGTTFVLQKRSEPRQRLLSAISVGTGITEAIDELISLNQKDVKGEPENLEGEWQLLWASQEMKVGPLPLLTVSKGLQIVKKDGQLENLVHLFPGFRLHANGNLIKASRSNMYKVTVNEGAALVGGLKFPLDIKSNFDMELLYIDNKIRIAQCNQDVILIHLRLSGTR